MAAVVTVPAVLGCLVLYFALRHRPDPYWEEALGHDHAGVGFRAGLRDPATGAALRLLFVGNSFVHRNEGAETVRASPCRWTSPGSLPLTLISLLLPVRVECRCVRLNPPGGGARTL